MYCFWQLYEDFREHLNTKICIIDLKRTNTKIIIKLYCLESNINVQNELKFLNAFHCNYDISDYDFNCLFVTEIISIRRDHFSTPHHFILNRL